MKRVMIAILAALMLASIVLTPAAAYGSAAAASSGNAVAAYGSSAATSGSAAATACGDLYTVQKGDYLAKIAKTCGVTLDSLIKANPEIKDINKIYPGQVIRTKAGVTLPTTMEYVVVKGDTLTKIATRFGTTVNEILKLNPEIKSASVIYVGQKIKLPIKSGSNGSVPVTGNGITLSANSLKAGATVDVKVAGFPANAEIDFRLGKDGANASVVADGKTNASGTATVKMTIPATAEKGEKWVVTVLTTEIRPGKVVKSPAITIVQ